MHKVLLISDGDGQYQARLSKIFNKLGYGMLCTGDAAEAVRTVAQGDISVMFADLDTIDGTDSLEDLVARTRQHTKIVILGPETKSEAICRAFELGADDYLRKPFNDDIFEARARCVFARYEDIRQAHMKSLESFLDTMPTMMAITDGSGRIMYANTSFRNKYTNGAGKTSDGTLCQALVCQNCNKDEKNATGHCKSCQIYDFEHEVFATGKRIIRKMYTYPQVLRDGRPHNRTLRITMVPIDYGNRKAVISKLEDATFERNAIDELTSTINALRQSQNYSEDQMRVNQGLVTYLQQINDTLQAEKNKLSLLFENMSSGFMLVEHKNDTLYFKEGNAKLGEIIKADITKYYNKKLRKTSIFYPQPFYDAMLGVLETGRSTQFTIKVPANDSEYNINMYMPEHDYVAVLINDITEETRNHRENLERAKQLKRLNLMLDDKNSALKTAVETKNKFISIIAHDLKNPLNAINGLSEILTRRLDQEADPRALEMAKVLHQSAKNAFELLDNLLLWARTQQNTIQFVPEHIDIHKTTAETINEIKVQAEKKHITLINNTTTGETAWADRQMYHTIVRNITSNAIKFTNEGGLIVISSAQTPQGTDISIEDNGIGMTAETMDSLMDMSKVKSTKGTSGETGTGMGLIITKEFIQRHKGKLHVESTPGKGSKFTITFPAENGGGNPKN